VSLAALAAVVYTFVAVHDYDPSVYRGGFLLLAVCSAVLLAAIVHPLSTLGRLLAHPVPRWVGERSYGIYLWHWPVLAFTRPGVDVHLARGPVFALQVGTTLLLAEASYRFVEHPIRRGALRRLRVRAPRLVAQPRTPFAVAGLSVTALLGLAALTPPSNGALPPGITPSALAVSQYAATHLVLTPSRVASPSPVEPAAKATKPASHRTTQHTHEPNIPRSGTILAMGDSVMLGASPALSATLGPDLHIDAVVSRQAGETIDRLFAYRAAGTLPRRVIVHVGDNGPVYFADWQRLKAALAGVPLVVLVNVRVDRSWQEEVNREMREAVTGWRRATIADWYDASAAPGTVVDGTHTSLEGAKRFAALIERALHSPNLGGVTH
jgi:hypothetical protein